MALFDLFLSRAIKRGEVTITYPDGTQRTFGTPDARLGHVGLRFTDKGAIRALVRDPGVGAAEMFMAGRMLVERGTLIDLLVLFTDNNRWEEGSTGLDSNWFGRMLAVARFKLGRYNSIRRSKHNVAHHYDIGNALYDLFLDADRQYSCAYFLDPANESLEQAQDDKKAHIAAKLAIRPGMRVLDIGCGWGGMALYLHQKTGADVLGVTLSEEQIKVARDRAAAAGVADKVKFELIDYREVTGTFDRIVSVGMFEHVGRENYRTFLKKCFDLLPQDGVLLLHTIGRAGAPGITDKFTDKYIFPGGYTPALSEILTASETLRWFTTDIEQLRLHYAYTLKHWYDRVVANRDAIVAMYDERFYRMWTWYLASFYVSFLNGILVNYQIQFARDRTALPITRDYMAEEERRLRAKP
ncbi:MAG: class I SAM-dependent methyltransferase [Sphingomonas sp.]|uniref:SAM-dependent methyltransferase n=1 Tax=Sphingomonas sp. TaxID=28214 RepID=UPI0012102344|nr:cyclopropane-fatty-acyl-phospholipid synthase family protein [Sphingomonas sp.]THD36040.1 MAG: class I SAM-dependent methyltransferase [Sphingomonas sp.]